MKRVILALGFLLVACGPSQTTSADVTPDPATASMTQGRFELRFTVERATVRPLDVIKGEATLSLLGPVGATITGSSSILGFEFMEIGGAMRHVIPVHDGMCAPHRVTSNGPLTSSIIESGSVVEGPNAAWYREFLDDPLVHLPLGEWDLTVTSAFFDGRDCTGQKVDLRATVRVHVSE